MSLVRDIELDEASSKPTRERTAGADRLLSHSLPSRLPGIRATGHGLDLMQVRLKLGPYHLERGGIPDAQARREVMQKHEPAILLPPVGHEGTLSCQAGLVHHRTGMLITRQRDNDTPVVIEDPPGQCIGYRTQLTINPLTDIRLQLPGIGVRHRLRRAKLRAIDGHTPALPKQLPDSSAPGPMLLDRQHPLQQILLEGEVILRAVALAQARNQLRHRADGLPMQRMPKDPVGSLERRLVERQGHDAVSHLEPTNGSQPGSSNRRPVVPRPELTGRLIELLSPSVRLS